MPHQYAYINIYVYWLLRKQLSGTSVNILSGAELITGQGPTNPCLVLSEPTAQNPKAFSLIIPYNMKQPLRTGKRRNVKCNCHIWEEKSALLQ